MRPLDRRQFLLGTAAAAFLAACSDDGDADSTTDSTAAPEGGVEGDIQLVRIFGGDVFAAGAALRAPIALGDSFGPLSQELAPDEITVTVRDPEENEIASLVVPKHGLDLPRPYYPIEFTPGTAGTHFLDVESSVGSIVSAMTVSDPAAVTLLGPGDPMPALATPTTADPAGVDPICTRQPPCDLHGVSVADALGTSFVLLISTPAFCQIGVCGPILDLFIAEQERRPELTFVHAEPFASATDSGPGEAAPYIGTLGLTFEPVAYAVGADGVIVERLDFIFDGPELRSLIGAV